MLLRQLDYFVKVVENNSFTKAAAQAYISQSAISQQIQALEKDLGVDLMVRQHRSFALTPAGEYLYRHAPPALSPGQGIKGKHDQRRSHQHYPPDDRLRAVLHRPGIQSGGRQL